MEVLYQDEYMIAVDKPAGYLVHPADIPKPEDMIAMKIVRDSIGKPVYSIHRLDCPTSGVLLLGIDREVSKELHHAFEARNVQKTYLAVVPNIPKNELWECNEPIQKQAEKPIREANTSFRSLQSILLDKGAYSLIEATPHTGRYHQIRRHLLHAGHPIVGDYRYENVSECDRHGALLGTQTQMLLFAYRLELTHPITKKKIMIQQNNTILPDLGFDLSLI